MKLLEKIAREITRPFRKRYRSSISDSSRYRDLCLKASHDPVVFQNFRSNPDYNYILEHVTPDLGMKYMEMVQRQDPALLERADGFRLNDLPGGPQTMEFPGIGRFSPTTMRYIKVLMDLKDHFGSLDGLRICEIGVGYGGQCRIIQSLFRPKSYCLVDLTPVLELTRCYLSHFSAETPITFASMKELKKTNFDLVISNYAFTELTRKIQDRYLRRAIVPAARGYITYNEITPPKYRSYRREELLKIIPGSRVIDEVPLTHSQNCILVWDRAAKS